MVRIRLSRGGAKKKPFYHIVVMDQRQRRDGRCLERIGTYDPSLSTNDRIKLDHERLDYWKSKGAQLSERVQLLREYSLDENSSATRLAKKEKNLEKIKQIVRIVDYNFNRSHAFQTASASCVACGSKNLSARVWDPRRRARVNYQTFPTRSGWLRPC